MRSGDWRARARCARARNQEGARGREEHEELEDSSRIK
ncbi:hypothetical protein A2U01_0104524, partial [Trifolium medium]|nr:hypothetical protein [Trifolium medium]